MTKFEVGKKYYCYSPYNSDRPYEFEVVKRTGVHRTYVRQTPV